MMTPIIRENMQLFPGRQVKKKPGTTKKKLDKTRAQSTSVIYEHEKKEQSRLAASTSHLNANRSPKRSISEPHHNSEHMSKSELLYRERMNSLHNNKLLEGRMLQEIPEAPSDAEFGGNSSASISAMVDRSKKPSITAHDALIEEAEDDSDVNIGSLGHSVHSSASTLSQQQHKSVLRSLLNKLHIGNDASGKNSP